MGASMYDLMKGGISYDELLEDLNKAKSEIDKERAEATEKRQAEKLRLAEACMQNVLDYVKIDNPGVDFEMTDAERKMLASIYMSLMDEVADEVRGAGDMLKLKTKAKPVEDPIDAFLRELNLK